MRFPLDQFCLLLLVCLSIILQQKRQGYFTLKSIVRKLWRNSTSRLYLPISTFINLYHLLSYLCHTIYIIPLSGVFILYHTWTNIIGNLSFTTSKSFSNIAVMLLFKVNLIHCFMKNYSNKFFAERYLSFTPDANAKAIAAISFFSYLAFSTSTFPAFALKILIYVYSCNNACIETYIWHNKRENI